MANDVYVSDCGLFIGLVTEPYSNKDFFKDEFDNGLFSSYKNEIENNLPDNGKLSENLYKPVPYRIFGEYNLAILSIVDDFEFGLQVFNPAHEYHGNECKDEFYSTQVINGIITGSKEVIDFEKIALATFLNKDNPLKYIGITKVKINNGILIGNGVSLLEAIKSKLAIVCTNENHKIIILDTFCNNELSVVSFSNNISSILDNVIQIRRLKFKDIENNDNFIKHSFLFNIPEASRRGVQIEEAHLFSETNTFFGFRLENESKDESKDESNISIQCIWEIKPGHEDSFLDRLCKEEGICISNGLKGTKNVFINCTISQARNIFEFNEKYSHHIRKFKTKILLDWKDVECLDNFTSHPQLTNYLIKEYTYKRDKLSSMRGILISCGVPKQTIERVLSMFNNYNNCIVDVVSFGSFIELRGFLEEVQREIEIEGRKNPEEREVPSIKEFNTRLDNCIRAFESAYHNRFHQSNKLNTVPNYSLEFNGGIQQFVSIFDCIYKSILNPLGANWVYSDLVHISGFEGVHSIDNTLMINTQHILNPELFSTIVFKEATNAIMQKGVYNFGKLIELNNDVSSKAIEEWNRYVMTLNDLFSKNEKIYDTILKYLKENGCSNNRYLNEFDHVLFSNIFSDILVFEFGFAKEKLMFYSYWNYFIQMQHFNNGKIISNDSLYQRYLIRLHTLKSYAIHGGYESIELDNYIPKFYDEEDSKLISFCKTLSSFLKLKKMELLGNDYSIEEFAYTIYCSASKSEVKEEFKNRKDYMPKDFNEFRKSQINKQMSRFSEEIKENKIINRFAELNNEYEDELDGLSDASFVQRFILAYLQRIFELNSSKENYTKTHFPKIKTSTDRQIRYHSTGVAIIYNAESRRKYYSSRSVFYKTLWDICSKIKLNYFFGVNESKEVEVNE
jgi:hypothetical protein